MKIGYKIIKRTHQVIFKVNKTICQKVNVWEILDKY